MISFLLQYIFYWTFVHFIQYILIIFRPHPLSIPHHASPTPTLDFMYSVPSVKAYHITLVCADVSQYKFIHWRLVNLCIVTPLNQLSLTQQWHAANNSKPLPNIQCMGGFLLQTFSDTVELKVIICLLIFPCYASWLSLIRYLNLKVLKIISIGGITL